MVLPKIWSSICGAALVAGAAPAWAQLVQPIPGVSGGNPVDSLSMHLRTLAANPRNFSALMGAGQSALDVGDPNAALGFFARAEEIDTRNGRAKAGLASALVMLEKPDDALRLFGEAVSLGVSDASIAGDRGLAHDLRGDNRRAQRDYAVALRDGRDDEVVRRYALSLGISGDRVQALALLDPLLRRQDQGAWRARAFILAMNDDVAGANLVARQVMPANLAGSMAPFLSRLARLGPAERAYAVNFGTMPSDGQRLATTQPNAPFRPFGLGVGEPNGPSGGLIPSGAPLGRVAVAPVSRRAARAAPVATAPAPVATAQATPGFSRAPASGRLQTRLDTRIAAVDRTKLPPEARGDSVVVMRAPMLSLPAPSAAVATPLASPPVVQADPTVVGSTPPPAVFEVASVRSAAPSPPPPPPPPPPTADRLASILSDIQPEAESTPVALPTVAEVRAAQRAAARKAAAATEAAATEKRLKDEKAKAAALAKANPARLWVQVATGSNVRGLATTWRKIRNASETTLRPYAGYSAPFKATNRVLAGPVKSSADVRAVIKALGKAGVSATPYSSEAGEEVVKLAAK